MLKLLTPGRFRFESLRGVFLYPAWIAAVLPRLSRLLQSDDTVDVFPEDTETPHVKPLNAQLPSGKMFPDRTHTTYGPGMPLATSEDLQIPLGSGRSIRSPNSPED